MKCTQSDTHLNRAEKKAARGSVRSRRQTETLVLSQAHVVGQHQLVGQLMSIEDTSERSGTGITTVTQRVSEFRLSPDTACRKVERS